MRDYSPSCPERQFPNAPIRTRRQTVQPDWIDYNGHMNVAYYTLAIDRGFDDLLEDWIGIGESFVARSRLGPMSLQSQICYVGEMLEGEAFFVDIRLVDHDAKRVHFYADLVTEAGELAATYEGLSICVDLETRKTAKYPDWAQARLERLHKAQAALERPKTLGQPLGIRRR